MGTLPEFNEIFIESLSSQIEGEKHLRRECDVFKIAGVINDRYDKIVWVFVRKCVCDLHKDASQDINFYEIKVPKDGFQIHTSEKCDIYINPVLVGRQRVYLTQRRCYCRSEPQSCMP